MKKPRISIVTPSYNQAKYIGKTLQSVADQDYENSEHIVIDACSTDGTAQILENWRDGLAWCCSEPDDGQADAINKGFRRATGDILAWLNSDDVYCPGAFREVANYFQKNPGIDAVMGDLETIDVDDRVLAVKNAVPLLFRHNLYSGCAVSQPATFFTRRAYEIAGELDTTLDYQMDYEFFLRMQARGVRFGILRHRLARFRVHGTSKTVSEYRRKFWRDFARIQEPYLRHVPLRGGVLDRYRIVMKWVTRAEIYLLRSVTRGVELPFRHTVARRKAVT